MWSMVFMFNYTAKTMQDTQGFITPFFSPLIQIGVGRKGAEHEVIAPSFLTGAVDTESILVRDTDFYKLSGTHRYTTWGQKTPIVGCVFSMIQGGCAATDNPTADRKRKPSWVWVGGTGQGKAEHRVSATTAKGGNILYFRRPG